MAAAGSQFIPVDVTNKAVENGREQGPHFTGCLLEKLQSVRNMLKTNFTLLLDSRFDIHNPDEDPIVQKEREVYQKVTNFMYKIIKEKTGDDDTSTNITQNVEENPNKRKFPSVINLESTDMEAGGSSKRAKVVHDSFPGNLDDTAGKLLAKVAATVESTQATLEAAAKDPSEEVTAAANSPPVSSKVAAPLRTPTVKAKDAAMETTRKVEVVAKSLSSTPKSALKQKAKESISKVKSKLPQSIDVTSEEVEKYFPMKIKVNLGIRCDDPRFRLHDVVISKNTGEGKEMSLI